MKSMYIVAIIGGLMLLFAGVYSLDQYYTKRKQSPQSQTQSTWFENWNAYQNSLSPLQQQFDELTGVWWVYYNNQNWDMCKETNDKMKLLSDQMHVLLLKYKATQINN